MRKVFQNTLNVQTKRIFKNIRSSDKEGLLMEFPIAPNSNKKRKTKIGLRFIK